MKYSGEHWGEYCLFHGQLEEHEHLRHVNFDIGSVLLPGFACVLSVGFPDSASLTLIVLFEHVLHIN